MNLYLLSRDDANNYDTYDSIVVCAESEDEARKIHPHGRFTSDKYRSWASSPDLVSAKLIGVADLSIEKGVVHTSYNAG